MAAEINKKRPTHRETARFDPERPRKCRKLLCESLLHSPAAFLVSQMAWPAGCPPNGRGFVLSKDVSVTQTCEKTGGFEQNTAQETESAGRIAVLVLSLRGKECRDPGTVMGTIKQMVRRTLFVTELVREAGKLAD